MWHWLANCIYKNTQQGGHFDILLYIWPIRKNHHPHHSSLFRIFLFFVSESNGLLSKNQSCYTSKSLKHIHLLHNHHGPITAWSCLTGTVKPSGKFAWRTKLKHLGFRQILFELTSCSCIVQFHFKYFCFLVTKTVEQVLARPRLWVQFRGKDRTDINVNVYLECKLLCIKCLPNAKMFWIYCYASILFSVLLTKFISNIFYSSLFLSSLFVGLWSAKERHRSACW